jgi:hypothetical protein
MKSGSKVWFRAGLGLLAGWIGVIALAAIDHRLG